MLGCNGHPGSLCSLIKASTTLSIRFRLGYVMLQWPFRKPAFFTKSIIMSGMWLLIKVRVRAKIIQQFTLHSHWVNFTTYCNAQSPESTSSMRHRGPWFPRQHQNLQNITYLKTDVKQYKQRSMISRATSNQEYKEWHQAGHKKGP